MASRLTETTFLETFLRKRISSAYRSANRYWRKAIDKLQQDNDMLLNEIKTLRSTIISLNTPVQIPLKVEVNRIQDSVNQHESTPISEPYSISVSQVSNPLITDLISCSIKEDLADNEKDILNENYTVLVCPIDNTSPESEEQQLIESEISIISNNTIDPTYAEICKRIPESLFKMKEFKQQLHWIKMNVPNHTGLSISNDLILQIFWKLWNLICPKEYSNYTLGEFSSFQDMMLERYDFLRRKELENDPYFKKAPPNNSKKRKKNKKVKNNVKKGKK